MTSAVTLRPATPSDGALLFGWVNRPDSLAQKKLTTAPIDWDAHRAWLARRLADPGTLIFVVEKGGGAVGQVRLQRNEIGDHVVDIYVDPDHRGQGLALEALGQAVARLTEADPNARVVAQVKEDNKPSAMLFRRAGFTATGQSDDLITFARKASR